MERNVQHTMIIINLVIFENENVKVTTASGLLPQDHPCTVGDKQYTKQSYTIAKLT